jgi:hypothetical protein
VKFIWEECHAWSITEFLLGAKVFKPAFPFAVSFEEHWKPFNRGATDLIQAITEQLCLLVFTMIWMALITYMSN